MKCIVFGASGDLFTKKLASSFIRLDDEGLLPENTEIIGVSRRPWSSADFRNHVVSVYPNATEQFLARLKFVQGDATEYGTYRQLFDMCAGEDILMYLSVSPKLYATIFSFFKEVGFPERARLLIEKPFGTDGSEAHDLDVLLSESIPESSVYRIDHYLAKETLQNILAFRFSNEIFMPVWNNDHIAEIHVTMVEKIGVETRGDFYDSIGALRDVGQNHVLQMLAAVVMDQPQSMSVSDIRDSRANVFSLLKPTLVDKWFRGQYRGYTDIPGVGNGSTTETLFSIYATLDHPSWRSIPIRLTAGKSVDRREGSISIAFKKSNQRVCVGAACDTTNSVRFELAPREQIQIQLFTKKEGMTQEFEPHYFSMPFESHVDRAYDKIIHDALIGDQTLFASSREVVTSWRFIDEVHTQLQTRPLVIYEQGTNPL